MPAKLSLHVNQWRFLLALSCQNARGEDGVCLHLEDVFHGAE